MDKKGLGFLLLTVLLIVSAMVFLPAVQDTAKAEAQEATTINVTGRITGWMWSTGVGWIKLSNSSALPVRIDNNNLSGYGWSDSIGWINFAPIGPYPRAPQNSVKINTENYDGPEYPVIGWARACSVFVSGCGEDDEHNTLKSSAELGGWDGWIRMENSVYDIRNFTFKGQAWGNLNLAWVGFYSGRPYNPPEPDPCTLPNPPDYCDDIPHCEGDDCNGDGEDEISVVCVTDPQQANVNSDVNFVATVSQFGEYTYAWSGDLGIVDDYAPRPTGSSFVTQYDTPDSYSAHVDVYDEDGVLVDGADCNGVAGITIVIPEDQCTLSLNSSSGVRINYYRDNLYNVNASKVRVNIENCDSPVSIEEFVTDTSTPTNQQALHDGFDLVCSADGSAGSYGQCDNLDEDTYYVWVEPKATLDSDTEIPNNRFGLVVAGGSNPIEVRFDYIVTVGG